MLRLGQPQHQRFDFLLGKGLGRQGGVFGQGIAISRRAIDQRTAAAQRVDVPVQRARRHLGLCRQLRSRDRRRQAP